MPDLTNVPIFRDLSPHAQSALGALAEVLTVETGKVLFYAGDTPKNLYILLDGQCAQTFGDDFRGNTLPNIPLDPIATLGGLPHTVKITVKNTSRLLCFPLDTLWASAEFSTAARQHLATALQNTQSRLNEVTAPIHYAPQSADLMPGPFLFDNTTLFLAFCDADQNVVQAILPDGLSLLQRPAKARAPILLGLAKFPHAYYEHAPEKTFAYTETTYFIPVRRRTGWGLYIPHIYPSSWEPILLGREIYGLPKRLGNTIFEDNSISLSVDDENYLHLTWDDRETASESRLVRGLSTWLGITGLLTEAAFQAGEVLRKITRLPAHRGINGYAHRRILAVDSDHEHPRYSVDELTRAIFGILKWKQIDRLIEPTLTLTSGPFSDANLTLREAYHTRLDMRLSTGKVEINYLQR
jgi:CRP-like cAMP-binding protein